MECSGNRSGVLQPTPLKYSHTLVGVDTVIRSSCMHRNLTIQHKLILINYTTTTVDDFTKKLIINTNIQQNYKHVFRAAYTTIE